ncbi:MAG: glycosyltransferase, partial [Planctomycetes bacterium]|nr:glycosyltransferase [Planctomycetota bacterium]
IVPTLDGRRGGRLARLRQDLRRQTFRDFETIVVVGDPRQGRAINRAARLGRGEILITLDDDTLLVSPEVFARLIEALDADPSIGIAGASTVVPTGASRFQGIASHEIPRRLFPIVRETIDSDMAQHPCMAIRRHVFERVGGEDEELVRGLDPLLRHKVREAGYRVVIAARAWVSHPLPEGLRAVLRMYFRNGRGSAFAHRHYPDRIYELSHGFDRNRFAPKRPLAYRVARHGWRFVGSVAQGRWVGVSAQAAYVLGFLYERFVAPPGVPAKEAAQTSPSDCTGQAQVVGGAPPPSKDASG